jgi:hypothetical protein
MPDRRTILESLSRRALLEFADGYGLTGLSGRSKVEIVGALAADRSIPLAELLADFSRDELKAACRACGLDDSGQQKSVLIDRLLGRDTAQPSRITRKAGSPRPARKTTKKATGTQKVGKRGSKSGRGPAKPKQALNYFHPEASALLRPEVGTQPQFKKKKPPATYRYDSSLAPELNWDGQNPARELGEWLLATIEEASRLDPPHNFPQSGGREFKSSDGRVIAKVAGLTDAIQQLKSLGRPFLNWTGKAERQSFDVPSIAAVRPRAAVHQGHSSRRSKPTRRDKQLGLLFELFGDPPAIAVQRPGRCAPTNTATTGSTASSSATRSW